MLSVLRKMEESILSVSEDHSCKDKYATKLSSFEKNIKPSLLCSFRYLSDSVGI